MWGSITFDDSQIVSQATSLINLFMPFVYIVGGITVFALVLLILIALAKKSIG